MRRGWQLFKVAVLRRPWIFSLLLLFYLVGLLVAGGPVPGDVWLALALLFAFPTAGIVGIVSERVGLLCLSAGELAIPRHAETATRFQLVTLSTVVGIPVLLAALYGDNPLATATLLCGAAAIGVQPALLGLLVVGGLLRDYTVDWIGNAYVQAALLAVSLYVLARWLRLPFKAEAAAASNVRALSDARHEREEDADPSDGGSEEMQRYLADLDIAVEKHGYRPGYRPSAENLGFTVGFEPPLHVRGRVTWATVACVVLAGAYLIRGRDAALGAYGIVMFIAVVGAFSRASSFYNAWRRSGGEQSLLLLAPSWPRAEELKPALARMAVACLPGAWLVWLATTSLSFMLEWIDRALLVDSAVVMAAVSSAIIGNSLLILSRPKRSDWRLSSLFTIGAPAVGTLGIVFGMPLPVGAGLLLAPAVVGAALFWRRPLRFPASAAS